MTLRAEPDMAGKVTQCPGCGTRLQIPETESSPTPEDSTGHAAPDTAPALSSRRRTRRTGSATSGTRRPQPVLDADPSNVNAWMALALGLVGLVATVLLLSLVRDSFVGQVFFTGGWIAYAEFLLFFWGLGIMFLKTKKISRQRSALLLDILPSDLSARIAPDDVPSFLAHLDNMPPMARDSLMVARIRRGLELFATRGDNSEVATLLNTRSDIDANRVAGSYALLKVFLWAIPILGFIGTVLGLSAAMAGFGAADMSDMDALRDSVSGITGGLSTAFNTTLLGLILAIVLIFPMSAIQKREEDCLNEIDTFCNDHLLLRLEGTSDSPSALDPATLQALIEQMRQTSDHLGRLGSELTEITRHHQQALENSMTDAVEQVTDRTAAALEQSIATSNKYFEGLERGIASLNESLDKLAGERVVIQQVKRKPWWKPGS